MIRKIIFLRWDDDFSWEKFGQRIDEVILKFSNLKNTYASYEENKSGCKVILGFEP